MALYQILAPTIQAVLRTSDGASVPIDPGNADYQAYQAWVAAGNTPDPYVAPAAPTIISSAAFFQRFTSSEQTAVWAACVANSALGAALTHGLSADGIDLTGADVQAFVQGLVTAGALTSARATAITTP